MEPLTHILPDIEDVEPLNEEDEACLAEIREVLVKHNRLQRFGVCLLHQHFTLAPDEILTESWNPETRTLITKPVKKERKTEGSVIETSWRLDTGEAIGDCHKRPDGSHYGD